MRCGKKWEKRYIFIRFVSVGLDYSDYAKELPKNPGTKIPRELQSRVSWLRTADGRLQAAAEKAAFPLVFCRLPSQAGILLSGESLTAPGLCGGG